MILSPMKEEEGKWIEEARMLCREWNEKYSGALHMFNKYGVHKAGKKGGKLINWTESLQKINKEFVDHLFSDLRQKIAPWPDTLAANIARLCDGPRDKIKSALSQFIQCGYF